MNLCKNQFNALSKPGGSLERNQIKIKIFGDLSLLPEDVQKVMIDSEERTKNYQNGVLNVCLCYNSKHEIFEAIESLAVKNVCEGMPITVENFESQLYGGRNVKPDILIRTSNEVRLSNFLLYQTDKTQYHFVKVLWPDFSLWDFIKIIFEFQQVHSYE